MLCGVVGVVWVFLGNNMENGNMSTRCWIADSRYGFKSRCCSDVDFDAPNVIRAGSTVWGFVVGKLRAFGFVVGW